MLTSIFNGAFWFNHLFLRVFFTVWSKTNFILTRGILIAILHFIRVQLLIFFNWNKKKTRRNYSNGNVRFQNANILWISWTVIAYGFSCFRRMILFFYRSFVCSMFSALFFQAHTHTRTNTIFHLNYDFFILFGGCGSLHNFKSCFTFSFIVVNNRCETPGF